jgi:DNA polymerase-4
LFGSPDQIARELKQRIKAETKLTASAGVAPNKFLAKLASDLEKPDGLVIVRPDQVQAFLDPLPISRLWGVGKATLPRFTEIGVRTFGDARRLTESELRERFGEAGGQFYRLVRGIDDRQVVPDREAKSMNSEITFPVDLENHECLRAVLLEQVEQVARRLRRHGLTARTVTLKIRSGDFTTITRRVTLEAATDQTDLLWQAVGELFGRWSRQEAFPVRLIGMGVSQLSDGTGQQLSLFGQEEARRRRALDRTLDTIRDRFGEDAIARGKAPHPGDKGRR